MSFYHCEELRFSHAQRCQALKCRSRFHCVIPNLSHQSRSIFSRDCFASEIAHEDCGLVNVFLSSKSQRRFGLSHQPDIALHASLEQSRTHEVHSFFGPNASLFLQGFHTKTCTKIEVRILRVDKGSSNQVPRAEFLHPL